nr:probable G-protein coupled receptor No9 [Lytechinus pictus]
MMNVSTPSIDFLINDSTFIPTEADVIDYSQSVLIFFTVIMSLLTVAMAVGNISVIVALVTLRPLRSASNQLTINLCVGETILGLVVMPYGTMTMFLRVPVWGEATCIAMAFIKMTIIYSTNLTLMAIGIDRYMKVKHTTLHRLRFKRPLIIILITWILSLLSALPPLVGWGWYHWVQVKPICTNDWIDSVSYTLFLVIGFMCIPLCVVFYCYGSIVRVVVQSRRRLDVHQRKEIKDATPHTSGGLESLETNSEQVGIHLEPVKWASRTDRAVNTLAVSVIDTPPPRPKQDAVRPKLQPRFLGRSNGIVKKPMKRVNRADIAVIRTMIIVVSTYVIFWYPYIICMLIKIVTKERMSFIVESTTIELAFIGMALNPIIYAVSNKGFRRDLKSAFKRQIKEER